MTAYLLDTTVLIDYSHGTDAGISVMDQLFAETSELYTCEVVACEALSGGSSEQRAAIESALQALDYAALDPSGATWAGDRRRLEIEAGRRKPSTGDSLIAALAARLGATVVTRNAKDFEAFDVPVLGYGEPTS